MDGIPGDFDVLLPSEDEQDESPAPSLTIGDVLNTLKKAKDGKIIQVLIISQHQHPLSQ